VKWLNVARLGYIGLHKDKTLLAVEMKAKAAKFSMGIARGGADTALGVEKTSQAAKANA
jgi:hypothetical protein